MPTMDNKIKYFLAGFGLLTVIALLIVSLSFNQEGVVTNTVNEIRTYPNGISAEAITWNNITLFDSTDFNEVTNTCVAERFGMTITIQPCNAQDLDGQDIVQYVNFSWTGGQARNTSWIFIYEDQLEDFHIDLLKNTTYSGVEYVEGNVLANTTITGVIESVNLGVPVEEICEWGNENNNQMRNVTYSNVTGTFHQVYCFTGFEDLGDGSFLAIGNITGIVEIEVEKSKLVWDDVTHLVSFLGNDLLGNNYSYYKVEEAQFQPNMTRSSKWTYTPHDEMARGKWHIIGYQSETGLIDSITNGQYIYVDPWWDTSWGYRQHVAVTEVHGLEGYDGLPFPVIFDTQTLIGQGKLQNDCDDLRAIFDDGVIESHVNVSGCNSVNTVVWVNSTINFTVGQNQSFDFYYGNPSATQQEYDPWVGTVNGVTANATDLWFYISNFNSTGVQANFTFGAGQHYYNAIDESTAGNNLNGDSDEQSIAINLSFPRNTTLKYVGVQGDLAGGSQLQSFKVFAWNYALNTFEPIVISGALDGSFYSPNTTKLHYSDKFKLQGSAFTATRSTLDDDRAYESFLLSALPYGAEEENIVISTYLIQPVDGQNFTDGIITFIINSTVGDGNSLHNVTLSIYNSSDDLYYENITDTSGTNETVSNSWVVTLPEGDYLWSGTTYGNDTTAGGSEYSTAGNNSFFIDSTPPTLNLNQNLSSIFTGVFPASVYLNYTASDIHLGDCWYSTSDNVTEILFTCNTTVEINFTGSGIKYIYYYANDTFGGESNGSTSFNLNTWSQWVDNLIVGEGGDATFSLELNKTDIGSDTVSAYLTWNNTIYPSTSITSTQNRTLVERYLVVPFGAGNSTGNAIEWNWTFNITNVVNDTSTTSEYQGVYSLEIGSCASLGLILYNFTLYDEETITIPNGTLGANMQIDLNVSSRLDPTISQQYNTTVINDTSMVICTAGIVGSTQYRTDYVAQYSFTDHVIEFYYEDNGTLDSTNLYQNISFYDLLTADNTVFLFSFTDEDKLTVPDAIVHVFRKYIGDGLFREVERGKQDDNGDTHLHLVEEDVIYYFQITLDGRLIFTSTEYNAKCLSLPCEVQLDASPNFTYFPTSWNLFDGGSFEITSNTQTRTIYLAFVSTTPQTMNLTIAKQDYAGDITVVGTAQTTATSGNISVTVPASAGNTTYYAIVYKDNEYLASFFVNLRTTITSYGTTGHVMGFLLLIALILMGASEGILFFVLLIIAFIMIGVLALLEVNYYVLLGFICALGILIWKLVKRGRQFR